MAELDYTALGRRIREARKKNGLTQEKLAEICSLSTAHIGHIERGTRIPSLETVFCISEALSVSVDRLVFDSVENCDNVLSSVSGTVKGKDPAKVKSFVSAVKALSESIESL